MNLTTLLNNLTSLPPTTLELWLAYLGAAGGVVVVLNFFKRNFKWTAEVLRDADKLIVLILVVMSYTVSVAGDFLASHPERLAVVNEHFAWILSLATVIFHLGGNNTYKRLESGLKKVQTDIDIYLQTGQLPSGHQS